MEATTIRTLQRELREAKFEPQGVDGKWGTHTAAALESALDVQVKALPEGWKLWSVRQKAAAFVQLRGGARGVYNGPVHGDWDPATLHLLKTIAHFHSKGEAPPLWRDAAPPPNPNSWPLETQAGLVGFFGKPGEASLTEVALPYAFRLSWDLEQVRKTIRCHKLVAKSLVIVLNGVLKAYGIERIQELHLDHFAGCYIHRNKKGGSTLSTHAWGIALDFDDARNQLAFGRDRAAFARPEYDAWWRCWEAQGWISLGRARNFDWMHVQAARVP